jgi:hypothetical protein
MEKVRSWRNGCELIIAAFRFAKAASLSATFAEQKATLLARARMNSQSSALSTLITRVGETGELALCR